jgi:hypothetical protein
VPGESLWASNDLVFGGAGFCSENARHSVAVPGSMIRSESGKGKGTEIPVVGQFDSVIQPR